MELRLLRHFVAVSVVSPQFVRTQERAPRPVRVLPKRYFSLPRRICLARRAQAILSPAIEEMIALIREACLKDLAKGLPADPRAARGRRRGS
jgi:DNA-binding transcriptional LysR family regulator